MAYSNGLHSLSAVAAGDLSTRQFHIVELTANVNEVALAAAGQGDGVLQNHPNSGEAATVAVDGETRVRAGGAITIGQRITSAATGYASAATSGAAGHRIVGVAKTAAASGSVFTMELMRFAVASGSPV
jgi:hypothetical protein